MDQQQQFRAAVMGGFHKGDVLNYIESTARAHAEQVAELEKQLEEARKRASEAEARAAAAEAKVGDLSPRAAQMEKTTGELEEKRSGLAAAERELQELRRQVSLLEPRAQAYDAVKEKLASVELEAHQRASQVMDDASRNARQMRQQTEEWITRVHSSYERLRTDVEASLIHCATELDRSSKAIADVSREFSEHDDAIKKLMDTKKQDESTKS